MKYCTYCGKEFLDEAVICCCTLMQIRTVTKSKCRKELDMEDRITPNKENVLAETPQNAFCEKCGAQIAQNAEICPSCGCAVKSKEIKKEENISTFKKSEKTWIIILSIFFVTFAGAVILLLTSKGFVRARDWYQYLHSDLGQLGKNLSLSGAIEWQQRVDAVKAELVPYYIGIGICAVLAIVALAGDILLFVNKKKK